MVLWYFDERNATTIVVSALKARADVDGSTNLAVIEYDMRELKSNSNYKHLIYYLYITNPVHKVIHGTKNNGKAIQYYVE